MWLECPLAACEDSLEDATRRALLRCIQERNLKIIKKQNAGIPKKFQSGRFF
jgi:hypothetical protein